MPAGRLESGANFDHSVGSVLIWSFSGPYFPAFGLNTERYGEIRSPNAGIADQKKSEYGQFSRSGWNQISLDFSKLLLVV